MPPIVTVRIRHENGSETTHDLGEGSYIFGRASSCDLVVGSMGVSRNHAQLTVKTGALVLSDLGSKCGTFVNAERITEPTTVVPPAVIGLNDVSVHLSTVAAATPSEGEMPEEGVAFSLSASILAPPPLKELADQARRRLELLYDLPLTLAAEKDLGRLYGLILDRVLQLIPGAVRGALLIKEPMSGKLELRASVPASAPPISRTLILRAVSQQTGFIWGDNAEDQDDISQSMAAIRIRTGMYAPLVWEDDSIGVLFVDNPERARAFSKEDLQFLLSVANYAASAVANQLLQHEIEQNNRTLEHLLTNFSPKIRGRLLEKSREGRLQPGGEKSIVTILLSDLRGFTKTSMHLDSEDVVNMLNDYFRVLGEEIFRHDGTIDKFIGDAVLAIFGSPEADPHHAWKALCAAIQMQACMHKVNLRRRAEGLPFCELGIGIYTGEVLHGFIGAEDRLEFTVIGDTVNKASRYCDAARPGEIVLGPLTHQAVAAGVRAEPRRITTKHESDLPAHVVDWRNSGVAGLSM
jgi:adenylate cyclase